MNRATKTIALVLALIPSAAFAVPQSARVDAFSLSNECSIVDTQFFAPMSLEWASSRLAPCMRSLSSRYGVAISASHFDDATMEFLPGIRILVGGRPANGVPAVAQLQFALETRDNALLGHHSWVESLASTFSTQEMTPRIMAEVNRSELPFTRGMQLGDVPSVGLSQAVLR